MSSSSGSPISLSLTRASKSATSPVVADAGHVGPAVQVPAGPGNLLGYEHSSFSPDSFVNVSSSSVPSSDAATAASIRLPQAPLSDYVQEFVENIFASALWSWRGESILPLGTGRSRLQETTPRSGSRSEKSRAHSLTRFSIHSDTHHNKS